MVDEGSSRPVKKRKLLRKPVKGRGGGTDCAKMFDKVKPNPEAWKKKREERRRKYYYNGDQGPRNIEEWKLGYNLSRHPGDSSSEDEILGWTEPGRMMRNLFDLPQTPKGSDNKRKDVPSGFVKKDDGSYIQNDEDDR